MISPRIKQLATNDEGFCFDPRTGDTYQLNRTACFILQGLKNGEAIDVIAGAIEKDFDVHQAEALADVQEFIQLLRIHGISE